MGFGIKGDYEMIFFKRRTNEVIFTQGFPGDKQNKINKLIKLRNRHKKKRIRKKINKKINELLNR